MPSFRAPPFYRRQPILFTATVLAGWLAIHEHGAQLMWITGRSMAPFLNADYDSSLQSDVVLVRMWAPWRNLHRGSIVTFWCVRACVAVLNLAGLWWPSPGAGGEADEVANRTSRSPSNPENMAVKRVVALEGDAVRTRAPYPWPTAIVPKGQVWVEGDNAEGHKTLDSNYYGPIPKSLIVGQIVAVVWPWPKAGWVRWQNWRDEGQRVETDKVRIVDDQAG